jgi:hypothetical protein
MFNSTLFPPQQDFAPPAASPEHDASPLHADKIPFIVCTILLGMIVTAAGAWAIYQRRAARRDLEKLDEESSSDSKTAEEK